MKSIPVIWTLYPKGGEAAMEVNRRGQERALRFGVELKLARVRAGMYQADLAEAVGVHPTSVSQWERGDRADVPDRDVVEVLDATLSANGALLRAAGYGGDLDEGGTSVATRVADAHKSSAIPGGPSGMIPIPGNLTSDDLAVVLAVARQLSEARAGAGSLAN